ncbi:putative solute carrier family 35 member G1 [Apostichopus japonicus]|uniref:Putative solute carrier family 35 member G1 n=1 Tax=Stichopus japonicus TaxID=307972 RepID=A0A2G8LP57_STIJA|nr:putative solute carrier family 35 member G1 [Apostichopus japonicus]
MSADNQHESIMLGPSTSFCHKTREEVKEEEDDKVGEEPNESLSEEKVEQTPLRTLGQRIYDHRGIIIASFSTFLFAFQTNLVRFIENDIHMMEVSFYRFLCQLIMVTPFMLYKKIPLQPESRKVFFLHITRGIFGTLASNAFFYSILYIPIGDAAAIVMGQLVFVGIFARLFIKEAFGILDAFLVLVSIAGVVLISQPPFLFGGKDETNSNREFLGAMLALFASVSFAAGNVVTSYLGKMKVDPSAILLYYALVGTVGTGLFNSVVGRWSTPPYGNTRWFIISIGVIHCLAQYFLTYSFSIENTVLVSIMMTNESIYSYILEFALFGVKPELTSLLGGGVLLTASVLASLKKIWISRRGAQNDPSSSDLHDSLDYTNLEQNNHVS